MHVGLIVDGGRRWAHHHSVPLTQAYRKAFERIDTLVPEMLHAGVSAVSLYLLSRNNLQRSEGDLEAVFEATAEWLSAGARDLAERHDVGFGLAGDTASVSEKYRSAVELLIATFPAKEAARRIYLLVAYSPVEELAATWRSGVTDMECLVAGLWVPERVDLVIRTGGAPLLSDFLPLQSGYAYLWATPQLMPDLTWDDVREVVVTVRDGRALRGL